jgi:hypothetical protein
MRDELQKLPYYRYRNTHAEFNQLQFVNHQLRKETKHLELRFNALQFSQHDILNEDHHRTFKRPTQGDLSSTSPLNQLLGFQTRLKNVQPDWLRSIVLAPRLNAEPFQFAGLGDPAPYILRLDALTAFCQQQPTTSIKYISPQFGADESAYLTITTGYFISVLLGNDVVYSMWKTKIIAHEKAVTVRNMRCPELNAAIARLGMMSNFRVYPVLNGISDKWYRDAGDQSTGSGNYAVRLLEIWMAKTREWLEVGI